MKEDSFYRAFEDRHRGSRELIKGRLRVYLPFINPLKDLDGECSVLDLGCGRGEWLELTGEAGFKAHGVDLDEGMLAACRERGLSVETQDAIAALHQIPDESLMIVSGFHIAEHISFDALQEIVKEALRVLKPAGLLILETPNPENLIVGTSNFYLDPTHQRPLPPLLLSFLPEHAGFSRTKILRLQESPDLSGASDVHLLQVLGGVSPDYAVVAQKSAPQEHLELFDSTFDVQYGLTLEMLSTRYETGMQKRLSILQDRIEQAQTQAQQAETHAALQSKADQHELAELRAHFLHAQQSSAALGVQLTQALAQHSQTQQQLQQFMAQNHQLRNQLDGRQTELDELKKELVRLQAEIHAELAARTHELQAVYASRSWRVTRPLRLGVSGLRRLLGRSAQQPQIQPTPAHPAALAQPAQVAGPAAVQPPAPAEQQLQPQAEPSAHSMQDAQTSPDAAHAPTAPTSALDTETSRRIYQQLQRARGASKGERS
ncbi:class I SAM-dependent methyltransferase [Thiomonas sp.]